MSPEQDSSGISPNPSFWARTVTFLKPNRPTLAAFLLLILFLAIGVVLLGLSFSFDIERYQYILAPLGLLFAAFYICFVFISSPIQYLVSNVYVELIVFLLILYVFSSFVAWIWHTFSHRTLLYSALAILVLLFIGTDGFLYYKTETTSGQLGVTLPDTPYAALYACGAELFDEVPFPSGELDARSLASDLKYILDGNKNILYLYTPTFAGMTQFETDKNGQSIPIITGSSSAGRTYQYNVQIPHLSAVSPGSGYFYMTINDPEYGYGNPHSSRINYPPRFIPGFAETNPDFSKVKETGPITITSYPTITGKFYPLSIEDNIWASSTGDLASSSISVLTTAILDRLPDLRNQAYKGCPGLGCPSRTEVQRNGDRVIKTITTICTNAGKLNNNQEILDAVISMSNSGSNVVR